MKMIRWMMLMGLVLVVVVATAVPTTRAGNDGGNVLAFDGVNDYVQITGAGMFYPDDQANDFTMETWVRLNALPGNGVNWSMLAFANSAPGPSITSLRFQGNGVANQVNIFFNSVNDAGNAFSVPAAGSPVTFYAGRWYHVAATKVGNTYTVYLNGAQIAQRIQAPAGTYTRNIFAAGARVTNVANAFLNGQLDDIRVWSVGRTQTQIQQDMYTELAGSETGLEMYWKLNEAAGTTAVDTTSNGRNGTLTNMAGTEWTAATTPIGDTTVDGQQAITAIWNNQTSATSGGLTVTNNTFLQDLGDDIVFGHNGLQGNSTAGVPGGIAQRWSRLWYCDLNDAAGTSGGRVDLVFDFATSGMGGGSGPSGAASNYRLLESTDGGNTFTDIASATAIDSGLRTVTFSGVDINATGLCSHLTLGTVDSGGSPTAVSLRDISANPTTSWVTLALVGALAIGSVTLLRRRPLLPVPADK